MQIFWLISLLFFLSGCATHAPVSLTQTTPPSWTKRQHQLQALDHWDIQGAIAVHAPNDSGSATFYWQQAQQNYRLSLFGPFGAQAIEIQGSPGQVVLKTAQGAQNYANNPEELLYQQTGWNLPISALHYWIRGLPLPGIQAERYFDTQNRLVILRQKQWEIHFDQYTFSNGFELPKRIVLLHTPFHIKIVISQWRQV